MSFSIFDLLLAIIFSQGLFLTIALQLIPNKNKEANKTLILLLIIASTLILGRVLLFKYNTSLLFKIAALLDVTIFLVGPLLFSYLRRLIFQENKVFNLKKTHFILPVLHVILFIWTLRLSPAEYIEKITAGEFYLQWLLTELLGIISVSFYLYISYKLILKFSKTELHQLSYNQKTVPYIKLLLTAILIFVVLWCISFTNYYAFNYFNKYFNYQSMWVSASLLMYVIGFYSLTQPSVFRMPIANTYNNTIEEKKNRLTPKEIEILKHKINEQIINHKIYQKHDLTLLHLSNLIKTSPNNLSWLLNNIYDKSFYEYINEYRIKDFIKEIENNQHKNHTLLAIAEGVGFNSKSTFNKSFKTIMNTTPTSYIKSLNA